MFTLFERAEGSRKNTYRFIFSSSVDFDGRSRHQVEAWHYVSTSAEQVSRLA